MNLVVFGAGASFGSQASSVPPLGAQLFAALQQFDPNGWGGIDAACASLFRSDFEQGMTRLAEKSPQALPPLQRAMAVYFFNFQLQADSLYLKLAKRLSSDWQGAFVTLNYERLLPFALNHAGQSLSVGAAPAGMRELCLPHGCCHIFCDGARGVSGAVSFAGMNVEINGPIVCIDDTAAFSRRIHSDAFPPVMSYFEPKKFTTAGAAFIREQRKRYEELVQASQRIALIGVHPRAHDDHIWGPLARASASILYCGGPQGGAAYKGWMADVGRDRDIVCGEYFATAFEQICGFVGV